MQMTSDQLITFRRLKPANKRHAHTNLTYGVFDLFLFSNRTQLTYLACELTPVSSHGVTCFRIVFSDDANKCWLKFVSLSNEILRFCFIPTGVLFQCAVLFPHAHWRRLLFAQISQTAARSAAKFDVLAHKSRIHLVCKFLLPRSKGQLTRSGQSQMCTQGSASNLKIVLWAQFQSECFQTFKMTYLDEVSNIGVDTYIIFMSDFSFQ